MEEWRRRLAAGEFVRDDDGGTKDGGTKDGAAVQETMLDVDANVRDAGATVHETRAGGHEGHGVEGAEDTVPSEQGLLASAKTQVAAAEVAA